MHGVDGGCNHQRKGSVVETNRMKKKKKSHDQETKGRTHEK